MKSYFAVPVVLCLAAFLGACQSSPSESSAVSKAEVTSAASAASPASESSVSTTKSEFKSVQPEFSTVFPSLAGYVVKSFQYDAFIPQEDQEYDRLYPFFLKGSDLYFYKDICNFSNSSDLIFYKYDLKTEHFTELAGRMENMQYGPHEGEYAYANNRIYASYGSEVQETVPPETVHYALDTEQNKVEVLKKELLDDWTSVCATFPVNDKEYVETYLTNDGAPLPEARYTYHVTLFGEAGERELINREYDWIEDYRYTVNDNKLYEYSQSETGDTPQLRVYDLNGNQLGSYQMPEILPCLENDEEDMVSTVQAIYAFGDYCLFSVNTCFALHDKCVLYNLKEQTVCVLDNCYYRSPNINADGSVQNHILCFYVDETDSYRVYSLNDAGQFMPVLEMPVFDGFIVNDGSSLVYLNAAEKQLYHIEL